MDLPSLNPWWEPGGLPDDPDLKKVHASGLNYVPKIFEISDLKHPHIYTLRGPRRVGKTVTLKLLIKELIEKEGIKPKNILWTTADTIRRIDVLETHLEQMAQTHKQFKTGNSRIPPIIIVDEITTVSGWQRVVKKLRDTGTLDPFCMILTGSSAYDLKTGAERLAGRRGLAEHLDRVILPMPLADFARQFPDRNNILPLYMKYGGFPFRVSELKKQLDNNTPEDPFIGMNVFDEIYQYEIERRKLDKIISMEVLTRLAGIGTTAVSYDGFAKSISISKDTARKYLDSLGYAYLLATYSSYDMARGRAAPKKDRKFLWIDPSFRYYASYCNRGPVLDDATVAEMLVGMHMCRLSEDRLFEGLCTLSRVFTWKSSNGHEVDFLSVHKNKLLPVEVKHQASISEWDWLPMKKTFGGGTLVTQSISKDDGPVKIRSLEDFLLNR